MDKDTVVNFILQINEENITTFEKLKAHDRTGAFNEYLSMEVAKERLIIPKEYHEYFRNRCDCGSEFIIKESLTQAQCCNPKCKIKMSYSMSKMLENFGVTGIGERTCNSIISSFDYLKTNLTHIQAFVLSLYEVPAIISNTVKGDTYQANVRKLLSKKYTFGEFISKLAIPGFGPQSFEIFAGINNVEHFLKVTKEYANYTEFFASRGVYDVTKINNFCMYIEDIVLISSLLESSIRQQGLQRLPIAITGSVRPDGVPKTKSEFIDLLNSTACTKDGIQLFEFSLSSALKSVSYIVADYRSSSRKYKEGEARGVLISSTQLLNIIRELVNKFEEEGL